MERIIYKSKDGQIDFGLDSAFVLSSTEGINSGDAERQWLEFLDTDGAEVGACLYEPRHITVKGFIRGKNKLETASLRMRLSNMVSVKEEGILEYICDTGNYKARAIPESLPSFGAQVQNLLPFVIYFALPDFYWQGLPLYRRDILKTTPNLIFPFTFPGKFGLLTTRGNVINQGFLSAPCVIQIYGTSVNYGAFSIDSGLEIINHTTKTHLLFNYDIAAGEVITVDTSVPSVKSSINGNILNRVDFGQNGICPDYTTDIAMKLVPGANDMECVNYNPGHLIRAEISFYRLFSGV